MTHVDFDLSPHASEEVRKRLNGVSYGAAQPWQGERDGDFIFGRVQEKRQRATRWHGPCPAVVLIVEEGVSNGEPIEPGSHRLVYGARVGLAEMFSTSQPEVGDTLTVALVKLEPRAGSAGAGRFLYRYHLERAEGSAPGSPSPLPVADAVTGHDGW
jgi:hypothetical protein